MTPKEIEIEITKDGMVKTHLKGFKGDKCMDYAKTLEQLIGPAVSVEKTGEYYESETSIEVDVEE
ncbi:MAG: DUF2997 domain-containing protein [Lentisphaerota bacterium]